MRGKKKFKRDMRYLPLDDIKLINREFLDELESVKQRLGYVKDEAVIKAFHEVLLSAYNAAIEIRTLEREVDYDIKLTEIKERKRAVKPWRRCWLWRLLFQPLTNRAQDIIEERAELDADRVHSEAEDKIAAERRALRNKGIARDELKAIIEKADASGTGEAFYRESAEPPAAPSDVSKEQENASKPAPQQLPGQMTLDDVQEQQSAPPFTSGRRPRPPRSCRRP